MVDRTRSIFTSTKSASLPTHWLPHDEFVWLPGTLIGDAAKNGERYMTDVGEIILRDGKQGELLSDPLALEGVDDICQLNTVSDAAILHSLRTRYARDDIYTFISCILVAVNPFKTINMYSSDFVAKYWATEDVMGLPPHIYGITALAFKQLMERQVSQAMLVSGESGAGKTENTKFVLLFISEVLRSRAGLADRLLEVNPLLEAFGNAKTVRNNNSSRFGKWIEVSIDPATRSLAGASVTDYLLEETRVCAQGKGERNYHIFYQLATDAAQKALPYLQMSKAADFKYLGSNPVSVAGIDDSKEFDALRVALKALKFTEAEEECLLRVAAAVLHIGNVEFTKTGEGSKVKNSGVVDVIASVLQVKSSDLTKVLCFKRITTGNEVIDSPLDPEKAQQNRDSTAKYIYSRLFKWVVNRCNEALGDLQTAGSRGDNSRGLFFGVLDIAGFEIFETNRLEQLFINLSNEKLQQFFNNSVFRKELREYEEEGIPITNILWKDNSDVLEMIEGKAGMLVMLDDATTGVKQTDLQYTEKVLKQFEKHGKFIKPKFVKDAPLQFGVRHYAGEVVYTSEAFLQKNVAAVAPEVLEILSSSTMTNISTFAQDAAAPAAPTGRGGPAPKKATVSSTFRKSLNKLIESLNCAEASFVRCVKPNQEKQPSKFNSPLVMEQLRLTGVMETVNIRKAGFLMRPSCQEFLQRFLIFLPVAERKRILKGSGSSKDWYPAQGTDLKQATGELMEELPKFFKGNFSQGVALGKTKVFMKGDFYRSLEMARTDALQPIAVKMQAMWRGYRTRIVVKEALEVNNALKSCSARAGAVDMFGVVALRTNVRRATVMQDCLTEMDLLIERAMVLPIKLPSLPKYIKARAGLAAQAQLARSISDAQASLDLPYMEALVARARGHGMVGELIDSLDARSKVVIQQLQMRKALQDAVSSDVIDDVKKVVQQASTGGFDKQEAWLFDGAAECVVAAQKRLEELVAEQQERLRTVADIEADMRKVAAKIDIQELSSLLFKSMTYNMRGELVDALTDFATAARKLEKFKDQGSAMGTVPSSSSAEELEWKMGDMKSSVDLPAMQELLSKAEALAEAGGWPKPELLESFKQRCTDLEAQVILRRQLQDCASCDVFAEVEQATSKGKELGLASSPDKWLLPDGPKLMDRARTRLKELEQIEQLKMRISDAAECLDCKELQSALSELSALGFMYSRVAAKEHDLFLKLQDCHFVEAQSRELRENSSGDAKDLLKIGNLAAQLTALGTRVDSAGMQQVAEMAAVRGGPRKAKDARKSVFDSTNPTLQAVAKIAFQDLANFSRLRDPLEWGVAGLANGEDEIVRPGQKKEVMLRFTHDCIPEALTVLPEEKQAVAKSCFIDLMRCMGDKPHTNSSGDTAEPILRLGREDADLADEIFVQVMKQLTQNPEERSRLAGWQFLLRLCSDNEVRISDELGEFVRAFMESPPASDAVKEVATEALAKLATHRPATGSRASASSGRKRSSLAALPPGAEAQSGGSRSSTAKPPASAADNVAVGHAATSPSPAGRPAGDREGAAFGRTASAREPSPGWSASYACAGEDPRLTGALLKSSPNWFAGWQLRWFEVSGGYLRYWKSTQEADEGRVARGEICLRGVTVSQRRGAASTRFEIQTATSGSRASKSCTLVLDCSTPEQLEKEAKRAFWPQGSELHATAKEWMAAVMAEGAEAAAVSVSALEEDDH
eukprot:TRINITY_DN13523_c0_g3_i1.p1 TRINITY_DN13523_c0_g3~~TRINITY_DN13523_c0_g3_i1.p1  ORF type:complete len:1730 (+),score=492.31 TRINITY_DN13523_c0_g3_i1:75-5192(+)